MNFLGYFFLCFAFATIGFAEESDHSYLSQCLNILGFNFGIGCENSGSYESIKIHTASEQARNTIDNIIQNHKQYEEYETFKDAKLVLKNGFIGFANSLLTSESEAILAFKIVEELLALNQTTAASQAMQQVMLKAEEDIYDGGAKLLQSLGDAKALSDDSKRKGLGEASQMLQHVGVKLINQMESSISSVKQAITAGLDAALQAIDTARQALVAVYDSFYDATHKSHHKATKFINDYQNVTTRVYQIENNNAEAASKDPEASSSIKVITKLAEGSIKNGASPESVKKLNESLVDLIGDFARIVSEEEEMFNICSKLAETDPSLAEDVFQKETEKSKQKIQNAVSYVFLSFTSAGHNYNGSSRDQIRKAVNAVEHGNFEVTSGHRNAGKLITFGFGVPGNIRSLVQSSAVKKMKYGEREIFKRIKKAAKITFDVLCNKYL